MKTFIENIGENSIWNTKTHTPFSDSLPLSVLEAGHFYANIDYCVSRNFHNSFLLIYTISGAGVLSYENEDYKLFDKTAILIDCKKPHKYYADYSDWEFLWLHFNGDYSESVFSFVYPDGVNLIKVHNQAGFSYSFNKIIDELTLFDANHCFSISCELQNLLLTLSKDRVENNIEAGRRIDTLSNKAIKYMEENLSDSITVKDIAYLLSISEYHFIRNFKKATGVSPYNYLIGLRITKSKRLLVESEYSIEAISGLCGFNDTANFISKFKKLTGETPLQYRKAFK